MRQVYILLTLTAVLLMVSATQATEATSEAAVLYLRVAPGARPAGMGEAFVSIADDATATYWNPAGLGNAPIAGMLKTSHLPSATGTITDVVTLRGSSGRRETWVIADDQLLMFDGENWSRGREFPTSSDHTLTDFVKTILNTKDEDILARMGEQVRIANCPVSVETLDGFIEAVQNATPADYSNGDDLMAGLERLKAGFEGCLLNFEQFKDLQKKLADGLKDSSFTAEESDRITYSLERALYRFLPRRLVVPHAVGIDGKPVCLAKTGRYLWVGTDNGLFRRANRNWARFGDDKLPSKIITVLENYNDYLMIGTDFGIVSYHHGAFTNFASAPQAQVERIAYVSNQSAYAVIGGIIYHYNGKDWSDSYSYTVRLDDTMGKLVARAGIYDIPAEYADLEKRIREANAKGIPAASIPAVVPVPDSSAEISAEESPSEQTGAAAPEGAYAPDEQWLIEGRVIRLPFSPKMRFAVTAMTADPHGVLWIGTSSGLLSFKDGDWTHHGYAEYVVRAAEGEDEGSGMTAEEIARNFVPGNNPDRLALLATSIDTYNELDGASVPPGRKVFVYNTNLGSPIHSISLSVGELYVGTEYGLVKRKNNGWEEVTFEQLDRRMVVDAYLDNGQSYFISSNSVTRETKGQREFVMMHVKWLPSLDLDMYYLFGSYVHNIRGIGTIGVSAIYLNYGKIQFTGETGADLGYENPFELTIGVSYGSSLSSSVKWGLTGKVIHSHLSSVGAGKEKGDGVATAFAIDVGVLVKITDRLQFGSAVTNIGPEITYVDAAQDDPLPRNLAIGLSYKLVKTQYNRLIIQGEANRMLTNLDRGFAKEMEFAIRHIGAEYWYSNLIALRGGYKYDKEGDVKHLTFGAGLQMKGLRFDFAYIPSSEDSPLSNTLRISFSANL